jgi:fermentation-respiration switch protein FrsA (DUF1100 family)
MENRIPRRFSRAGLPVAVALIAIGLVVLQSYASAYFYDVAIARKDKSFLQRSPDLKPAAAQPKKAEAVDARGWLEAVPVEKVSITSRDGLGLVALWIPAAAPTARTAIVMHGYSGNARTMAMFARHWSEELGCNVLLPDARGHGESEGDYIGFGWPERRDQIQWVDWIIDRTGPEAAIALHGVSMGGATTMMTAGEPDLPAHVRLAVEDCGYTSARDELAWNLTRMYGLPAEPIITDTSRLTKRRVGYSFEEASALEQVKRARVPIQFIHGEDDTFVPYEMVHRLYAACASEKRLLSVPGAGHGQSVAVDPAGYWAAVDDWAARHW